MDWKYKPKFLVAKSLSPIGIILPLFLPTIVVDYPIDSFSVSVFSHYPRLACRTILPSTPSGLVFGRLINLTLKMDLWCATTELEQITIIIGILALSSALLSTNNQPTKRSLFKNPSTALILTLLINLYILVNVSIFALKLRPQDDFPFRIGYFIHLAGILSIIMLLVVSRNDNYFFSKKSANITQTTNNIKWLAERLALFGVVLPMIMPTVFIRSETRLGCRTNLESEISFPFGGSYARIKDLWCVTTKFEHFLIIVGLVILVLTLYLGKDQYHKKSYLPNPSTLMIFTIMFNLIVLVEVTVFTITWRTTASFPFRIGYFLFVAGILSMIMLFITNRKNEDSMDMQHDNKEVSESMMSLLWPNAEDEQSLFSKKELPIIKLVKIWNLIISIGILSVGYSVANTRYWLQLNYSSRLGFLQAAVITYILGFLLIEFVISGTYLIRKQGLKLSLFIQIVIPFLIYVPFIYLMLISGTTI